MTIRRSDWDLATGNNDGTTWADAFKTPADATAAASAGDIMLCRGTSNSLMTLATAGTQYSPITWVGVNASGVYEYGTRCVLDANSAIANCLDWASKDYNRFMAFDFLNGTGDNVIGVNKDNVIYDCRFVGAGASGLSSTTCSQNFFKLIQVLNSTANGILIGNDNVVENGFFNGNGSNDISAYATTRLSVSQTIMANSGLNSISCGSANIDGCIFNNSGQIAIQNAGSVFNVSVKNSLFTNMSTGGAFISIFYTGAFIASNNAFWNNSGTKLGNSATYTIFPYGSSDVDPGEDPFVDEANDDLTIKQSITSLINIAVALSGNNISYEDIAMGTIRSAGGGGGRLVNASLAGV